ncbi:MAG TPA: tyrosine protein phosphatase [Actinoplanes sp.]|nr:tyrosine protein phosphatase [Actinoplanes sp.]
MRPALHVIAWPGPGRLATMGHPRGGGWLADEMTGLAKAGVDVYVCALTPDECRRLGLAGIGDAVTAAGIDFLPFPIDDRGVPATDDDAVVIGVRLAAHLRAGRFVVTQCFAGIGRSTLLAVVTLAILGMGADEAIRLVGEARGLPVPDTEVQHRWLRAFVAEHGGRPGPLDARP